MGLTQLCPRLRDARVAHLADEPAGRQRGSIGACLLELRYLERGDGDLSRHAAGADQVHGLLREARGVSLDLDVDVRPPLVALEDGPQRRNAFALEARIEPGAGVERCLRGQRT